MSDQDNKKKPRRLSKGQRKHLRRLKQAARKEAGTKNPQSSLPLPVRVPRKQEHPGEED